MSHTGSFLCMNVSGGTKPNVETAQLGVLEAFQTAMAQNSGNPPGAILLQEYSWADKSLNSLVEKLSCLCNGDEWQVVRQWSDAGGRDAVVLFNTAMYAGREMTNGQYMQEASSHSDLTPMLGKLPAATKEQIVSYKTRWAGVQLAALDPKTGKASRAQFLLVSYHGREKRRQTNQAGAVTAIQDPIKAILAQDFVAEVARAGVHTNYAFGVAESALQCNCVPALVAGDWNAYISAFYKFDSLAYGTYQWTCQSYEPQRPFAESSVRVDSDGAFKGHIDYVVAVNHLHDHELSCDVAVTDVLALAHSKRVLKEACHDHDPLLVRFEVINRHPGGRVVDVGRPAQRSAAAEALEKIKVILTGRPSGRQLQEEARTQPPPSFKVAPAAASGESPGSSPETTPVKTRGGGKKATAKTPTKKEKEKKEAAAVVQKVVAAASAPPQGSNGVIIMHRSPARYNIALSPEEYKTDKKLIDAVKAMAMDALGIENSRGKRITDFDAAAKEHWWPKGVTTMAQFDELDEKKRVKMYKELQGLLKERGVVAGTEAAAPAAVGNVLSAGKLTAKKSLKGLSGLFSFSSRKPEE